MSPQTGKYGSQAEADGQMARLLSLLQAQGFERAAPASEIYTSRKIGQVKVTRGMNGWRVHFTPNKELAAKLRKMRTRNMTDHHVERGA